MASGSGGGACGTHEAVTRSDVKARRRTRRILRAGDRDVLEEERRDADRRDEPGVGADLGEMVPEVDVVPREVHLGDGMYFDAVLDQVSLHADREVAGEA